jgi:hypothetical protein
MYGIRRFICATMKLDNSLPGKVQTERVIPPCGKSTVESQNGWSGALQDSLEKCYNEKSGGRYGDKGDS